MTSLSIFKKILLLSATPPTIIYPYPILPLLVFSFSRTLFFNKFLICVFFSSLFYGSVNLWNHVNDVEEDIAAGKSNIIIENERVRNILKFILPMCYFISFLIVFFFAIDKIAILLFSIVAFVTWIYSDKIFIGKYLKRWKDSYITELLTYLISIPLFTLTLWAYFSEINYSAIFLMISITLLMVSGLFLKDIKDISGDRKAGLKTLGVVFDVSGLLKISITLLFLYYASILIFSILKIYPFLSFFSSLCAIGLIYTTKHFIKNKWHVTLESIKPIRVMISTNLLSLLILILSGFLNNLI